MSARGFTSGLVTGAVIGAALGILTDPIKDKQYNKMVKSKHRLFRTIGGAMDNLMDIF